MPMSTELLFFLAIIVIGFATSYEDAKTGCIRNVWIVAGLSCVIIFYYIESFFHVLPLATITANFTISLLVAFILWELKYWSAGDAKLFSLYTLLTPLGIYRKIYFSFFPSFQILFNTFIPATIFLFILSLFDFLKNADYGKMNPYGSFKTRLPHLTKNLSGFAFIFLINQLFLLKVSPHLASIDLGRRSLFLILFFAFRPLSTFFDRHKRLLIIS